MINGIFNNYQSDPVAPRQTPLEIKVSQMQEREFLELMSNDDLPAEQKAAILEAWEKRVTPEMELIEKLNNDDLDLEERIEAAYNFKGVKSPAQIESEENAQKLWLNDVSVNVLDKIETVLKKPENEPEA